MGECSRITPPHWKFVTLMSEAASAIARAIRKRVGWSRIGVAIGLLIVTAAVAALFHLLRDIEIENVITALRETTTVRVILAGVFVACGLVTLSAYDCFALRTIGRDNVPYRVAAF